MIDPVIESDLSVSYTKSVTIKIEVTKPNEFGVFEIITQIGDETPTRKIAYIKNENIVKTKN